MTVDTVIIVCLHILTIYLSVVIVCLYMCVLKSHTFACVQNPDTEYTYVYVYTCTKNDHSHHPHNVAMGGGAWKKLQSDKLKVFQ